MADVVDKNEEQGKVSSFILRYYYFMKDETAPTESLINIFKQNSLITTSNSSPPDFLESAGFFYNLSDASGKMNILGVRTPSNADSWVNSWERLIDWETKSALCADDLMGRLTVLVTLGDNWSELLQESAPLLSCREAGCDYTGNSQLFRLFIDKKDNEAIYVYAPESPQAMSLPLLARRLPILHGNMIFLQELDMVLSDRNLAICREREGLEKDLIRILHTKLVMNQASLAINEELEHDIEILATAFAKLVGNKKLTSDGIKRLESMLARIEKQIINEPAFQMDAEKIQQMMANYHDRVVALHQTYEDLELAEDNYQAAIEVVQSKIQVMNSRTNIATQEQIKELLKVNSDMQKRSLTYQFAAGLIEFIVLAYYSDSLWSHLTYTAAEIIPSWIQLIFLLLFSGNTVLLTHYLAEYVQGEPHVQKKLILAGTTLTLILMVVVIGTVIALRHAK